MLCQFRNCPEHSGRSQKRDSMLEYHQPECNILPDHISNRMPCRNLRLYQAQTIADLRVRSGMRDLESESLVGVSVVDLFILRDLMGEQSPPCASFLSVLNGVNNVANHVNIKFIVVIIIQGITNKVVDQIPLRICKQLLIDGLRKSVRHGDVCLVDLFILRHPERILGA